MGIMTTRLTQSFWAVGNSKPGAMSGVVGGVGAGAWAKAGRASAATAARADRKRLRVMDLTLGAGERALEEDGAVGGAEFGFEGAVGVGHQAQHVAGPVDDAGDVAGRAVG